MQKIILIGNLSADPETRSAGDKEFYTAKLAVSVYDFKAKEQKTEWYSILLGDRFEKRVNLMKKGMKLYIEGRLEVKTYKKDDETRIDMSVSVNEVEILSKIEKGDGEESSSGSKKTSKSSSKDSGKSSSKKKEKESSPFDDEDEIDDLPFD